MAIIKERVLLSEIENINSGELNPKRIKNLLHGFSPFGQVLKSRSEPVALDGKRGKPYRIIDGRHRVYLARQKGYHFIPAAFV